MTEQLQILISANVAQAQQSLRQVQQNINDTAKESSKLSKIGDALATGMKAAAKVITAATAAAATGIAALTKGAVNNFGEYEQLVGGVDTLFKESSQKVQQYADEAYKTSGLSANAYMETITSFSASLLQGLGGDTAAAAEIGNMAVIDMADNANKMGTSMESIQNAYQGFAKQNFTMLDNLKLGYGGTQAEMARLINDSGVMGDTFVATAENVKDIPFDKMIEAIHEVQTNLGITGTTALEASTTIQGSAASMKAAWTNLVSGLGQDTENFDKLIMNFVDSLDTTIGNVIPVVQRVLDKIPNLLTALVPKLINIVNNVITQILPSLATAAVQIVAAIAQLLPTIVEAIVQIIPQLLTALTDNLPTLLEGIIGCITALIAGLAEVLPMIVEAIIEIIPMLITALVNAIPQLLQATVQLLMAIVQAIPLIIPPLLAKLPEIIQTIIKTLVESIDILIDAAVQLLMAIVEAIPLIIPALLEALPTIINSIVDTVIENIPTLLDAAIELFMALIDAIPKILPQLVAAIPKIIQTIVSTLMNNIPKIAAAAFNLFIEIVKAVPKIAGQLLSAIGDLLGKALRKLGEFALSVGKAIGDGIANGVKNVINWILDKAVGIINGFISAINSVIGVINLIPGVNLSKISKLNVPKLAKGGVIDSATLAVIGEQGKEAVVPLENNTEWIDMLAARLAPKDDDDKPVVPIILQVDGKTFAQTSIKSINDLTKQTGKLDLVLT